MPLVGTPMKWDMASARDKPYSFRVSLVKNELVDFDVDMFVKANCEALVAQASHRVSRFGNLS